MFSQLYYWLFTNLVTTRFFLLDRLSRFKLKIFPSIYLRQRHLYMIHLLNAHRIISPKDTHYPIKKNSTSWHAENRPTSVSSWKEKKVLFPQSSTTHIATLPSWAQQPAQYNDPLFTFIVAASGPRYFSPAALAV